jgi:hypothetical protein
MDLKSKNDVLKYVGWYMDLLSVHISLFGLYSSNYFILVNKIILVCHYNHINFSDIEKIYNESRLSYFEIDYSIFIKLNRIETENMN